MVATAPTKSVASFNVSRGAGNSFNIADDSFDAGDSFDPLQNGVTGSTNLNGTLTYTRPDGGVVTVQYLAEETPALCVFAGTAVG